MNKKILAGATLAAVLTLSACNAAPAKMPVASPTTKANSSAIPATQAPASALPADKAKKETPVLLKTVVLQPGVTARIYRVGTGEIVAQQLEFNPNLKKNGVKVGQKVAVIRYTIKNTTGKPVDVLSFTYGGIFQGGAGEAANFDGGFASSAARLGFEPTPLRQFTDKNGKAGNWSLKNDREASWNVDWVLEAKGVLAQNLSFGKKVISNVRIDLLKKS